MAFPDPVANALCLELVNTVDNWNAPVRDALGDAASATSWAALLGLPLEPTPDDPALRRARGLRTSLHECFRAVARGQEPSDHDLAAIEDAYASGLRSARLATTGRTYGWAWPDPGPLDHLLARAAASAVQLLSDGPLDRIGECPSCGWLFLDTSRNGRRRWCSMESCGARVKARRHYAARSASTDE
jgi:predicted RNA-binding Zn ribbon-like protein